MNWPTLAAQLVQMPGAQQRAYLRTLNPSQLLALRAAAVRLQNRVHQMNGLGALGISFNFGSFLSNIGGALMPFASLIPGVGPLVSAVGTAAFSALNTGGQQIAPAPPPPPPPPPAPAAGGFTLSPALMLAGVALLVLSRR